MKEFRIVACIDICASTPEEAYRRVRELFANKDDVACETTEEWYGEDGRRLEQATIDNATGFVLSEEDADAFARNP